MIIWIYASQIDFIGDTPESEERQSWPHSLRQRDKWKLRSLQARISLERKEHHDEKIAPQSLSGI
jgi:hypothetical protein